MRGKRVKRIRKAARLAAAEVGATDVAYVGVPVKKQTSNRGRTRWLVRQKVQTLGMVERVCIWALGLFGLQGRLLPAPIHVKGGFRRDVKKRYDPAIYDIVSLDGETFGQRRLAPFCVKSLVKQGKRAGL